MDQNNINPTYKVKIKASELLKKFKHQEVALIFAGKEVIKFFYICQKKNILMQHFFYNGYLV